MKGEDGLSVRHEFHQTLICPWIKIGGQGTLPSSEFFVIKNIHTKFTLKNQPNAFNVSVDNGQVTVLADKTEKVINSGKQISIDASNTIKESIYIGFRIYAIITGALILILSIVLVIYRKTRAGGKIIGVLKKMAVLFWKCFTLLVMWLWEALKFLFLFTGRTAKRLTRFVGKKSKPDGGGR